MGEKQRGIVERVTVDFRYPDGSSKQRVIKGDELERLALLALKPSAVRDQLPNLPDHAAAVRSFEEGDESEPDIAPAMMTVYDDGTYSLECRPNDHHPPVSG